MAFIVSAAACSGQAGTRPSESTPTTLDDLQDSLLRWPLPSGAEAYADIDGRRLHQHVVEQAEISRRYRDRGHPQFWGPITGTSADAESAEWLAAKFREIGLSGDPENEPRSERSTRGWRRQRFVASGI